MKTYLILKRGNVLTPVDFTQAQVDEMTPEKLWAIWQSILQSNKEHQPK